MEWRVEDTGPAQDTKSAGIATPPTNNKRPLPSPQGPGKSRLTSLIGLGKGSYGNTREIDEYIRYERDSWDS